MLADRCTYDLSYSAYAGIAGVAHLVGDWKNIMDNLVDCRPGAKLEDFLKTGFDGWETFIPQWTSRQVLCAETIKL